MRHTADHVVLMTASLIGLWAGLGAPAVSPVRPAGEARGPAGVEVLAVVLVDLRDQVDGVLDGPVVGRAGVGPGGRGRG